MLFEAAKKGVVSKYKDRGMSTPCLLSFGSEADSETGLMNPGTSVCGP